MSARRATELLMGDGAGAPHSVDIYAVLAATGIERLTLISSTSEVATAVDALAAHASRLGGAQREQLIAEASDVLRAAKIRGGPSILRAVVRDAIARARRSNGQAFEAVGDPLPDGVEPHTDAASAYRLARDHGQDLRFCGPFGGWFAWTTRVWACDADEPTRRALDVARQLLRYALDLSELADTADDRASADQLLSWARRSQSEPSIRRALELARHIEPIACSADVWNRDPWLLACSSGTLDLRTGAMGPHRREDMITWLSADPEGL